MTLALSFKGTVSVALIFAEERMPSVEQAISPKKIKDNTEILFFIRSIIYLYFTIKGLKK